MRILTGTRCFLTSYLPVSPYVSSLWGSACALSCRGLDVLLLAWSFTLQYFRYAMLSMGFQTWNLGLLTFIFSSHDFHISSVHYVSSILSYVCVFKCVYCMCITVWLCILIKTCLSKYLNILGLVDACDNLSACLFVYLPHDFHFHVPQPVTQPALVISYIASLFTFQIPVPTKYYLNANSGLSVVLLIYCPAYVQISVLYLCLLFGWVCLRLVCWLTLVTTFQHAHSCICLTISLLYSIW